MRRALAFLTPLGRAAPPSKGALAWFPVAGLLIGAALGAIWWLSARAWPYWVAAAITVAADLGLTGMLHADGLVDSADGLLPHMDRNRRLEVMAEPTVGAFGVMVGTATLLLRWVSLASIRPSVWLLAGLWCASRTWMATVVLSCPYARTDGLASGFGAVGGERAGYRRPSLLDSPAVACCAALGLAASIGLSLVWNLGAGAIVVAAATISGAAVVVVSIRRLGGFTGDVLGASGMVGETVGLVVAAAW